MAKLPVSVQLYTLRDLAKTDLPGVLKSLAKIGYSGGELAGYGNLKSATEVRKAFDDAGLVVSGAHVGIDQLEKDLDGVIADHKTLGNTNVIIPWLGEERRQDAAAWRAFAATCNDIGRKLADAGLTLSYHNHDFEFKTFDGTYGLDIFWQHSDPKYVNAELDVYWVVRGGVDPVAYIKQLGSRVKLIHLKDMATGEEKKFAPVGTGVIDFVPITDAAAAVGVEWGAVEQDNCYGMDPLESVRISFDNLKKLGIA
jgi:sugar phosphate isomerase/epimerase